MKNKSLWKQVEELGWEKNNYNYNKIEENILQTMTEENFKKLKLFVGQQVTSLYGIVKEYEKTHPVLRIGSDDGFSDVCYHIVGLGEKEYNRCVKNPLLIEERYNSKYGNVSGYKESFAYCFHADFNKVKKNNVIRCIVTCTNANGELDLFFVKVQCTKKDIEQGQHYDAAREAARQAGYEADIGSLVYDEDNAAGKAIIVLFVWSNADTVGLMGVPPTIS